MSFFELNVGSYGLFAAQQGLSVTSNNIANANTTGYSRQILTQTAGRPLRGAGIGMIGTGVNVTGIERIRNSYLDTKMWSQKPLLGEYRVKSEQSSLIEGVFGEPSDVGFTTIFNDFFNSLDTLSKIPDEGERKVGMMQTMKSFTQYFNSTSSSLEKYQRDLNFEVKNKVDEINIITRRLESLNKQIYQAEMHGGTANSLRDERELQIDRLSELVNVDAKEYEVVGATGKPEKRYSVKLNGQTLVDHFDSRELDVKVRTNKNNPRDVEGLYDVVWKDGLSFKMNDSNLSGELKGAIDMRDGNANAADDATGQEPYGYRGIPYYINRLDKFVQKFAISLNKIYSEGINEEGEGGSFLFGAGDNLADPDVRKALSDDIDKAITDAEAALPAGKTLTDKEKADIKNKTTNKFYKDNLNEDFYAKNFNASNFSVNQEILDNPGAIRTTTDPDKVPGGNDLILDLMEQKHNRKMFNEGEPNDYMVSIFSELGINAKEASMYSNSQSNMVNAIENQRLSVSQVSQSEEMVGLVKYQQAYQAAARIISTMDMIYDITINRLGVS